MRFPTLLAAFLAVLLILPGSASADRYRLSLSTWGSPQHPQVREFVPRFVDLVEEKSEGRIRFRVFEGGEMVNQQNVNTAVPQGTIDISLTTLDNWSGRISDVSVLTSPLWTWPLERARDELVPGQPVLDYFDAQLREIDTIMIAMFDIGPPVISSRREIRTPEDIRGRTVRVYSRGAGLMMQELGAAPTTIGVGEVYSALQRGTVDAALGGLGGAVGLKHFEVTDHMFVPMGALGTLVHAYVMNLETFESLPPDLQEAVMEAAAEARAHMQQYVIDSYDDMLQVVTDSGTEVYRLEPGEETWSLWRDRLSDMTARARNEFPADLVEMVAGQSAD